MKKYCVDLGKTLLDNLFLFIMLFVWLAVSFTGVAVLQDSVTEPFLSFAILVWLLVILELLKRMVPYNTFEIVYKEVEQ